MKRIWIKGARRMTRRWRRIGAWRISRSWRKGSEMTRCWRTEARRMTRSWIKGGDVVSKGHRPRVEEQEAGQGGRSKGSSSVSFKGAEE